MTKRSPLYRYLICLLLLLLPLQSMAMALMPLSMGASHDNGVLVLAMPCHDEKKTAIPQHMQNDCEQCSLCHLCRVFAPVNSLLLFPQQLSMPPLASGVARFLSYIPEQPQRPPRGVLV
jgi:hypothetical protein